MDERNSNEPICQHVTVKRSTGYFHFTDAWVAKSSFGLELACSVKDMAKKQSSRGSIRRG